MKIKYLIMMKILMVALFLVVCQKISTQNKDKLDVIVSIPPQKAFVRAAERNRIDVKKLIPPG